MVGTGRRASEPRSQWHSQHVCFDLTSRAGICRRTSAWVGVGCEVTGPQNEGDFFPLAILLFLTHSSDFSGSELIQESLKPRCTSMRALNPATGLQREHPQQAKIVPKPPPRRVQHPINPSGSTAPRGLHSSNSSSQHHHPGGTKQSTPRTPKPAPWCSPGLLLGPPIPPGSLAPQQLGAR